MTQSFLVNALASQLKREGWTILFSDFVNARRGGAGPQGALNYCFELIFDQFPDIVATKDTVMLIVEVNLAYKEIYATKLKTFQSKQIELFQCVKDKLGLDVKSLLLGLSFVRKPPISVIRTGDFRIWVYNRKLGEFKLLR
jgi:hypothetical protein